MGIGGAGCWVEAISKPKTATSRKIIRRKRHIPNWVKRHADRLALKDDLEDWTQDLVIHMRYLPRTSKHREAGREDIVQTFDPAKHHGASQPRFSELHQPLPCEQVQDHALQTQKGRSVPHGYANQRLNLVANGKAHGRDAKTSNRT
jgi:hypothetical protein